MTRITNRFLPVIISAIVITLLFSACDQAGSSSSAGASADIGDVSISPAGESVLIAWETIYPELLGDVEIVYTPEGGSSTTVTVDPSDEGITISGLTSDTRYTMEIRVFSSDGSLITTVYKEFTPASSVTVADADGNPVSLNFVDADGDGTYDNLGGVFWFAYGQEIPDADNVYEIDIDGDGVTDAYLIVQEDGTSSISSTEDGTGSDISVTQDESGNITSVNSGDTTYTDFERGSVGVTIIDPQLPEVSINADAGTTTISSGLSAVFTASLNGSFVIESCSWYLDGEIVSGETSASISIDTNGLDSGIHSLSVIASVQSEHSVSDTLAFTVQD